MCVSLASYSCHCVNCWPGVLRFYARFNSIIKGCKSLWVDDPVISFWQTHIPRISKVKLNNGKWHDARQNRRDNFAPHFTTLENEDLITFLGSLVLCTWGYFKDEITKTEQNWDEATSLSKSEILGLEDLKLWFIFYWFFSALCAGFSSLVSTRSVGTPEQIFAQVVSE